MIAGYREWTAASPPIPAQFASKGKFILTCPPQLNELYAAIRTELQK